MTRVVVTGCRRWKPADLAAIVLTRLRWRYGEKFVIVHGAAEGVDATFADACEKLGVAQEPHPARWADLDMPGARIRRRADGTPYVANAGPIRNAAMIAAGAEFVLAFHRSLAYSKGTGGCVKLALAAHLPVWWWRDAGDPIRVEAWEDVTAPSSPSSPSAH